MIKGSNKYEKLAETLEGIYTLKTFADRLKIDQSRATYVIHRLRKLGYVETNYGAGKKRIYSIFLQNRQKGTRYTDRINEAAPSPAIRIAPYDSYYVHGRVIPYEEALIYAVEQDKVRYIIASLSIFRKITDWSLLYKLAKKENLARQISALYEVARMFIKKVRKMPKRFRRLTTPKKNDKYLSIVKHLSSDDFKDVEKKWKVYIPLNRADLWEYTILK